MTDPSSRDSDRKLAQEVRSIHTFLKHVHADDQWSQHPVKVTAISFLKGIGYGLGAIVAAVIVAPFVLWFLQSVAWPPIIANVVTQVIHQMERGSLPVPPAAGGQ